MDNYLLPDLVAGYHDGSVIGCYLDDDTLPFDVRRAARYGRDKFRAEQPHPIFATAPKGEGFVGSHKGKFCPLWKYYIKADPAKGMKGAQTTGDCVSWGSRTASDITRLGEIYGAGENELYLMRQATAMLYSRRGHTGQGADPASISDWHIKDGVLLEQTYLDGKWDFTDYSKYVNIGIKYGRSGLPDELLEITRQHRMKLTSELGSSAEIMDALENKLGVHYGFSLAVASTGNPISRLSGRTAHDTAIVGFDARESTIEKFGDAVIAVDQSWGKWNTVTNLLPDWEPIGEGQYFLLAKDVDRQLGNNGTAHCFSAFDGFPAQPYDNMLI